MFNGTYVNISKDSDANWFVLAMSYISPARYNCEGFIRRLTGNVIDYESQGEGIEISEQRLLEMRGYTAGDTLCLTILSCWAVGYFLLALVGFHYRYRKV